MAKNNKWRLTGAMALLVSIAAVRFAAAYCGGYGLDFAKLLESRVAELRDHGQAGLDEALTALDRIEKQIAENSLRLNQLNSDPAGSKDELNALGPQTDDLVSQRTAWQAAIDQIGGQRSCTVSRLYWYTDLDKAKAESERAGKPILSLRMLGKLTDEFSCANSRFFRTSLYSNKEISDYLRDHYVLHWQSVRPVPKVTIDFGDGRKLERTLTGNSAHYALTSTGQPLDVLPGLYSPQRFKAWLEQMVAYHHTYTNAPESARANSLVNYHTAWRDAALRNWDDDIRTLGEANVKLISTRIDAAIATARAAGQDVPKPVPNAAVAAKSVVSKTAVEAPMLRFANLGGKWMEKGMDDDLWQAVANLHRSEVRLDDNSVRMVQAEFPNAIQAGQRATLKGRVENPLLRVVQAFESSISLDTVRNEYLLHRQIHDLFVNGGGATTDVDKLNEWVYAELFLTPSSDPWLGLAPNDVYTALENGGQVVAKSDATNRPE